MFYTFRTVLVIAFIELQPGEKDKDKADQPQDQAQTRVHIATDSSVAPDADNLFDDDGEPSSSYEMRNWQADILAYSNNSTSSGGAHLKRWFTALKPRVFNTFRSIFTTCFSIFWYTSEEQGTVTRDLRTALRAMRYNSYAELFFMRGWFRYMLFEYVIPTCISSVAQYTIGWGSLTMFIAIVPAVVTRLIWAPSCMVPLTLHTL